MDIVDVLERLSRSYPASRRDKGEIATAADIIRRARQVLAAVEWAGEVDDWGEVPTTEPACPICEAPQSRGVHMRYPEPCALGALIDYVRAEAE